jgi:methylmalonyl-CoA mutase
MRTVTSAARGSADMMDLAAGAPLARRADWQAAVDRVLKGGSFAKLVTTTSDGIEIKPLYRAEDAPAPAPSPGHGSLVRGARAAGTAATGWDVRQIQPANADLAGANGTILADLEGGATSIELQLTAETVAGLDRLLDGVMLDVAAVGLRGSGGAELLRLLDARHVAADTARADLGEDPVGAAARLGRSDGLAAGFRLLATLTEAATPYPGVRVLRVDGGPFAEAGASPADELAAVVASFVTALRELEALDTPPSEVLGRTLFAVTVGTDQFGDIAKLRALRRLVARVAEVVVGVGAPRPVVQASTAQRVLAHVDPWVNLLRTTIGCFAAGVGGADIVALTPYDLAGTEPFGRRLARNTQLVLQLESNLARVIDPAGGSWYVESLTEALAAEAWRRFRLIESEGGIVASLEAGALQARIAHTAAQERAAVVTRRRPLTGVSEFPDIDALVLAPPGELGFGGGHEFPPLIAERLAAPFEALRADRRAMKIFLANLGPVATHTARATFAKNLFEAGGLHTISNDGFPDAATAAAGFAASGAAVAVICSSDETYAEHAEVTAAALKAAGAAQVWLAGRPGERQAAYEGTGIDGFVYVGVDVVATVERVTKGPSA